MAISSKVHDHMSRASWIRRMFEEGNDLKARLGAENVFDFTLGNPVMEPPIELVDTLRRLTADPEVGAHRYMPNAGYPEVRAKVAAALAAEAGIPIEARHLVMTVGAACGLNITLKALLDPGDEVLILAPYFVEYIFYADNHGGVPKVVETDAGFLPDPAAIDAAIGPRTKVLILNSPNNPTGVVYPRPLLEELAATLERAEARVGHPIYVISDEPYRKISYGDEVVPSLAIFRNGILCTSHSKDLALAGERIGVAAVHPDADGGDALVAAMTFAIRILGFVNAPALMQRAVADLQHVTVDVGEYRRNRDLLLGALRDTGLECNEPGGAFYLFPRCPVDDDVAFIRRLQEHRLLAVPGSGFGRGGYFRLSYCVDREMIERALPALRRAVEES